MTATGKLREGDVVPLPHGPCGHGAPGASGASTATFITLAQPVGLNGLVDNSPQLIVSKQLPPGSWAVVATVNSKMLEKAGGGDVTSDLTCQLRSGANVIGSATDRRFSPGGDFSRRTLSMNGGAFVEAGTGPVSIWCGTNFAETIETAQIMMIQVGGFS